MSLDEFLVTREAMLQHADPKVANDFMEAVASENDAFFPMARMLWRSSLQPEVLQGLRLLQFRDERGGGAGPLDQIAGEAQVAGLANERKRNEVHFVGEGEPQVRLVLFGHRRH